MIIFKLILIFFLFIFAFYLIFFIYIRRFFKPKDELINNYFDDFNISLNKDLDSKNIGEIISKEMFKLYNSNKFWPVYMELLYSSDKRYNIASMIHDIIRDPDMRLPVILCILPNLLLRTRKTDGFSIPMHVKRTLSVKMDSTFFSALTAEQIMIYLKNDTVKNTETKEMLTLLLHKTIKDIIPSARKNIKTKAIIFGFSENPKIKNTRLNEFMRSYFGMYYDSDDTSVILSILAKYFDFCINELEISKNEILTQIELIISDCNYLNLLSESFQSVKDHVYPNLRKKIIPELRAYVTFFTSSKEDHNDIDPCVNIDILEYLISNRNRLLLFQNTVICDQIKNVLEYIMFLSKTGLVFDIVSHYYYSPVVFTFFWKRYIRVFKACNADEKRCFDPDSLSDKIDEEINKQWNSYISSGEDRFNVFDLLLLINSLPEKKTVLISEIKKVCAKKRVPVTYEFYFINYPIKSIYGCTALTLALMLSMSCIHAEHV